MKPDVEHVISTWKKLAPEADDLVWRQRKLEQLARELIKRHDTDFACDVFVIISASLDSIVGDFAAHKNATVNRTLVQDAKRLLPRLKDNLREACRIHRDAARHKWYAHPGLTNTGRLRRRSKRVVRLWQRSRGQWQRALLEIARDPAFKFLTAGPFAQAAGNPLKSDAGNPLNKFKSALRSELKAHGLNERQIDTVLRATRFGR